MLIESEELKAWANEYVKDGCDIAPWNLLGKIAELEQVHCKHLFVPVCIECGKSSCKCYSDGKNVSMTYKSKCRNCGAEA